MAKKQAAAPAEGAPAVAALPRPRKERPATPAASAGPKLPPIEEGRRRFFVDLQERHAQYIERYAALLASEKRRPCTVADALEHIVRHTMMLDQTKAGQFVNAATVPAVKR